MAIARYKDLCIDAVDATVTGAFWAAALGLSDGDAGGGDRKLGGPTPAHTVWVNTVPEPLTVKQRVHIDVNGRSVAEYEDLGARVLPDWGPFPWTVMADPEGGEFCVFERDDAWWADRVDGYRLYELGVDSADPGGITRWWAEVLGAEASHDERGFSYLEPVPGAPFDAMVFVAVPEPKTVKNRIHWDVSVVDRAAVDMLVERGARVLREPDGEVTWSVLADPEGNEFCAFVETA